MQATHILGIDISKDKFDVCLRTATDQGPRHAATFHNNAKGFKDLCTWLRQQAATDLPLHACLEATSRYGDALALDLHQHGHTVSVVNPRRTRHYADSRLMRTQNDTIDAALIADFCASQNPRSWRPVAEDQRQLQNLVRTRGFFLNQKQQCLNRLETADPISAKHLRSHVRQLDATLSKLEKQIIDLLQTQPDLARQVELADSIPGVGLLTAAIAVAELPPIHRLEHAGQAVALAGLDPRKKTSGTSVHTAPRLSKMGSRLLRQTLYMAALAALRYNPIIRALGERLRAKGKGGKLIVAAAMRKLVRLIYGVLKQGQPFDPHWQNRDRAVGLGGLASDGDMLPNPQLGSPSVATA
jgi:transposase